METPNLGWIVLYVDDVAASAKFYGKAFGLATRFVSPDGDYGELETGATSLGLCRRDLAARSTGLALSSGAMPACNLTLVVLDVPAAYAAAIAGGATPVAEPETMSWGQVVSYVQDPDGHLVELATTVGG